MAPQVGLQPAWKRQTKHLTEHRWQSQASQVYGGQRTDFRNQFYRWSSSPDKKALHEARLRCLALVRRFVMHALQCAPHVDFDPDVVTLKHSRGGMRADQR